MRLGIAVEAYAVGSQALCRRRMVGTMPSRVKRSSAQNRTQSNLRLWSILEQGGELLAVLGALLPLSWSTYSCTRRGRAVAPLP